MSPEELEMPPDQRGEVGEIVRANVCAVRPDREPIRAHVRQHRFGHPAEIAEAAVWLCSDRASFVTGPR